MNEKINAALETAVFTLDDIAALYNDYDSKKRELAKQYGAGSISYDTNLKRTRDSFLHDFEMYRRKLAAAVETLRTEHERTAPFDMADLPMVNETIKLLEGRDLAQVPAGILESIRRSFAGKDEATLMLVNATGESGNYFKTKVFTPSDHTDLERHLALMRINPDGSQFELIAIRDGLRKYIEYMAMTYPIGEHKAMEDLRTAYLAHRMGLASLDEYAR